MESSNFGIETQMGSCWQAPCVNVPRWTVAIIDSGLDPASGIHAHAQCSVQSDGTLARDGQSCTDLMGHGTRVANVICSTAATPSLCIAQVLNERGTATVAAVASAIHWALSQGAGLIHMSLGLTEDRTELDAAVRHAVGCGVVVVASAPARGTKPYPARYEGVIAATGDARCQPDEVSALHTNYADFGGCVRLQSDAHGTGRGASIGAAHVTRFILERIAPGNSLQSVRTRLDELAAHHGAERR